jgi:hypothetical protein
MKETVKEKIQSLPAAKLARAGLRLLHPALVTTLARDWFDWRRRPKDSRRHLDATIQWICRAQDRCGGAGVSAGYSVVHGWHPPYPETTGYIIPTFFDYARLTSSDECRERGLRMADWELEVQLPSGATQGGLYCGARRDRRPTVFNTGQVILGLCRAFVETRDQRYLDVAERAGEWLVSAQSPDGSWRAAGPETETTVHAYDARTAWSLLEVYQLIPDEKYKRAAQRNLEWTLEQQQENGWFRQNAFFTAGRWNLPLTHTIAYVMEGLIESWLLLGDERYFDAARKTAERLLRIFELRRFMAGEFDGSWKTTANYSCLTGDAQIAGVWLRIYQATRDTRFLNAALKLNDYVKATQSLSSTHPGVRGGVKGSQPIFGRYTPGVYVNWGAKFLADSLMLEEQVMEEFELAVRKGERLGPGDLRELPELAVNQQAGGGWRH